MSKDIPHSDPYWPGPKLNVKQLGLRCGENHLPGYEGCWELREFVSGVDFANPDSDGLMGSVARRNADHRIFAAPDWRFCGRPDVFEVLWLQERRRKRNVVPPENQPAS